MGRGEQVQVMQSLAERSLISWSLAGASIELLKYRENAVYKVKHRDFTGALRVHQPGNRSDDILRSEFEWMRALAAEGLSVPSVIPTSNGESFVVCALPGSDCSAQVDLFEWIDGQPLGTVEEGIADADRIPETYRTVGRLAAKVHNQSSSWMVPAGFRRHRWDEAGLAGETPLWGQFWMLEAASASEAALLRRCKNHLYQHLGRLPKSRDKFSLIHADLVPDNLMIDGRDVKLIDFDDAGFGWHLFELATALYFITDEPFYEEAKAALVSGYREERPLSDEELELLPLFFFARGSTYLGWVHSRKNSETAEELTDLLLRLACGHADTYLSAL